MSTQFHSQRSGQPAVWFWGTFQICRIREIDFILRITTSRNRRPENATTVRFEPGSESEPSSQSTIRTSHKHAHLYMFTYVPSIHFEKKNVYFLFFFKIALHFFLFYFLYLQGYIYRFCCHYGSRQTTYFRLSFSFLFFFFATAQSPDFVSAENDVEL